MNKWIRVMLVTVVLFISGCSKGGVNTPSYENFGLVTAMAYDYVDQEEMQVSIIMPQSSKEAQESTQFFQTTASLSHQALIKLSLQADSTITLNQLRVVLIGEEFANSRSIREIIEFLYKESEVRGNLHIAVVKGSAANVLQASYPDKTNTSVYLNNFLQPKHIIENPSTTVHRFIYDETNPIIDPIVPVIALEESVLKFVGVAGIKEGRIATIYSTKEASYILVLRKQMNFQTLMITIDENWKEKVVLRMTSIESKIYPSNERVEVKISYEGELLEYSGPKKEIKTKDLKDLEQQLNKQIEKEIQALLVKNQSLSIDTIGLFEKIRMKSRKKWTDEKTRELLENASFHVVVKTQLRGAEM